MRQVVSVTKRIINIANVCDSNGLEKYADVLHGVLRRMANDESEFLSNFGDYSDAQAPADWWEDEQPSMEELERADLQRELFELMMESQNSPEGLSLENIDRKQQILNYLSGNPWDSHQSNPDNERLRNILEDPNPGYFSEQLDAENGIF